MKENEGKLNSGAREKHQHQHQQKILNSETFNYNVIYHLHRDSAILTFCNPAIFINECTQHNTTQHLTPIHARTLR